MLSIIIYPSAFKGSSVSYFQVSPSKIQISKSKPSTKMVKLQNKSFNARSPRSFYSKLISKSFSFPLTYAKTYNTHLVSSLFATKQPTRNIFGLFSSKKSSGSFQTIVQGVEKAVIGTGDGNTFPQKGQTVEVDYVAYANGKKFDASRDANGAEFRFVIGYGQVIKGWDIGIASMSLGEKAILKIAPEMSYGEHGILGIPPNANLEFEIHLHKILPSPVIDRRSLQENYPKVFKPNES